MKKIFKRILCLSVYLTFFLVISCSKEDASVPIATTVIPEISIQNITQVRSTSGTTMRFYVVSSKSISNAVTVDYSIVDGTAVSPKDYATSSGTLTIAANETQTFIDVQIKGDPTNLRISELQFTVNLFNSKLCTIRTYSAKGTLTNENGTYLPTDDNGYTTPLFYPSYSLLWSDEFSSTTLNSAIWNQEIGNNNGWGNNELEYYTNSLKNTFVSNGNLIIEARKEALGGFNYTSGRLTTQNKKQFKFGRIDIRAKLPVGKGIWPALWMLGANISSVGWPACGEIDIMELIGTYPNRISGTIHWKPTGGISTYQGGDYFLLSGDYSQKFHVFSLVWQQDSIKWYVDDVLFLTKTATNVNVANNPFNADQFLLLNVAVGGNWPGSPDGTTTFPQRMFVDYVRVFQ